MVSCFERKTQIVREQISGKLLGLRKMRKMINLGLYIKIILMTYTVPVPYFLTLGKLKECATA